MTNSTNNGIKVVSCLDQFFHCSIDGSEALLLERALVGDFRALARWFNDNTALVEQKCGIGADEECKILSERDLLKLKGEMGGGEQYAVDRIIEDMNAIQKRLGPSDGDRPRAVLVVLKNHDAAPEEQTVTIECSYNASALDGVRPGSLLRKAENFSQTGTRDNAGQPCLVLKAS